MSPVRCVLAISFVMLAVAAIWFLTRSDSKISQNVVAQTPPPTTADSQRYDEQHVPPSAASVPALPVLPSPAPEPPRQPSPSQRAREESVPALEQRIRATKNPDDRAELIADLAKTDSADAVLALERLFTMERHPKVQVALIASLVDVDAALRPDARLRILRAAVTGQPRDVRTTALEVLAESKDPAELQLLQRCSVSDPDHEVREVAAALYKANTR